MSTRRRVAVGTVEFLDDEADEADEAEADSVELKSEDETESISSDEARELYEMQQEEAGHSDFINDDTESDNDVTYVFRK